MYSDYKKLMRKCINLAKKGAGRVSPNPLTGCIIFDDNYRIISQGYHKKYGENHAERNAILNSKEDVKGKNLIVNLEPCAHWGKTPPCADLIIEKGIKKVIIGMIDPNPIVSGRGIKKLQNAGIEVITGVLEEECKNLNKIFIKNQLENKPYITIKTAVTADGKIASRTKDSKWITDETSRKEVHKLRNIYDAVLTTSNTVLSDNPNMTSRIKGGRNPVRIIIDTHLKTSSDLNIYKNNTSRIIIVTSNKTEQEKINKFPNHIEFIKVKEKNKTIDIKEAVKELYKTGIRSILIEAGGKFNNSVIKSNEADSLIQFIAPKILADENSINSFYGNNIEKISQCYNITFESTKLLKNDIIIIGYFKKNQ